MAAKKKSTKRASRARKKSRPTKTARTKRKAAKARGGKRASALKRTEGGFTAHFRLERPSDAAKAKRMLRQEGLQPILETSAGGIVVVANRAQVERLVEAGLKERSVERTVNRSRGTMVRRSYAQRASDEPPPTDRRSLGCFVFPVPFQYWQQPSAYPPRVPYYHLHPARDLARLFGVEALHARGIRGQGIRVVMIDSGFYRHPYYADSGIHNSRMPQITTHAVLPWSDPDTDDVGHGTGIVANVFGLAPECEFHHVKDDDDPLAAMVIARGLQPDVITCSWGWSEGYVRDVFANAPDSGTGAYLRDLETEIAGAVNDGAVVLFASGNGPAPGSWPSSAPGVISVGGAFVGEDLQLRASSYATSFASEVYPGRVCPDVCGLVGPAPYGLLFAMPTQPNNLLDADFSAADGTQPGDGWLIASGTSSAAPQVAAVVALLRQLHGPLSPGEVLEQLQKMAVGVHQGTTASGHIATAQRPNAATGYGFVTFRRPHLENGYTGLY